MSHKTPAFEETENPLHASFSMTRHLLHLQTFSIFVVLALCTHPVEAQFQRVDDLEIAIPQNADRPIPDPDDPAATDDPEKPKEEKPDDVTIGGEAVAPNSKAVPEKKLDPQFVRLHLADGSVVAGKLNTMNLTVSTDFGLLSIPVQKIKAFRPGLSSYTSLRARLKKLVEDLGADEYTTRQQAHRELSILGMKIKHVIREYGDEGNAERKRHLEEIRKEIQEQSDEMIDEDEEPGFDERPWIEQDEIVTDTFTIIGKIQEDQFALKSKYGELKVSLNDVAFGDRPTIGKPEVNKSITVDGSHIAQTNFKSTTIRVEEGDVVTIRAEGKITMTPWGNNEFCGPNGATNYGWYQGNDIEAGSLVAKIGSSGKIFKVGEKLRFVTRKSGTLSFAIGMNSDYANGYSYPGNYKLKLKIRPK